LVLWTLQDQNKLLFLMLLQSLSFLGIKN
jgi:hypothetical protein